MAQRLPDDLIYEVGRRLPDENLYHFGALNRRRREDAHREFDQRAALSVAGPLSRRYQAAVIDLVRTVRAAKREAFRRAGRNDMWRAEFYPPIGGVTDLGLDAFRSIILPLEEGALHFPLHAVWRAASIKKVTPENETYYRSMEERLEACRFCRQLDRGLIKGLDVSTYMGGRSVVRIILYLHDGNSYEWVYDKVRGSISLDRMTNSYGLWTLFGPEVPEKRNYSVDSLTNAMRNLSLDREPMNWQSL